MITDWVSERFFWVFLVIIFANVMQRRHQKHAPRKRMATLYLAVAAFLIMVSAQVMVTLDLPEALFALPVVIILVALFRFRDHTFPFRLRSPATGRRYSMEEILYQDDPDE